MSKYHITKSGKPALCKAKVNSCPLGTHFNSEKEAFDYIASEYDIMPTVNSETDNNELFKKQYENQLKIVSSKCFKNAQEEDAERTKLAKLALKLNDDSEESDLNSVLSDISQPDSGATISLNGMKVTMPAVGFCASPYPEFSKTFRSSKEVNPGALHSFITNVKNKQDIFQDGETYIGLWNDPETGTIYLDVSKRYFTAEEARVACEENDQIAYFDLQTFESVDVDRNALSGQSQTQ